MDIRSEKVGLVLSPVGQVEVGTLESKSARDSGQRPAVRIRWYKGQGSRLGAGIQDSCLVRVHRSRAEKFELHDGSK